MPGNGYFPDERYRVPAESPARIPAAVWQLAGMFLLFFALLWWLA